MITYDKPIRIKMIDCPADHCDRGYIKRFARGGEPVWELCALCDGRGEVPKPTENPQEMVA